MLRIENPEHDTDVISSILDVVPTSKDRWWDLDIEELSPQFTYALRYFADILEGKTEELKALGYDITVWYLREYKQQCNMEFSFEDLQRLVKCNATLCISCWQEGGFIDLSIEED